LGKLLGTAPLSVQTLQTNLQRSYRNRSPSLQAPRPLARRFAGHGRIDVRTWDREARDDRPLDGLPLATPGTRWSPRASGSVRGAGSARHGLRHADSRVSEGSAAGGRGAASLLCGRDGGRSRQLHLGALHPSEDRSRPANRRHPPSGLGWPHTSSRVLPDAAASPGGAFARVDLRPAWPTEPHGPRLPAPQAGLQPCRAIADDRCADRPRHRCHQRGRIPASPLDATVPRDRHRQPVIVPGMVLHGPPPCEASGPLERRLRVFTATPDSDPAGMPLAPRSASASDLK
jgi:hypothetical protein